MRLVHAIFAKHADIGKDDAVSMMGGCVTAIRAPSLPFAATFAIVTRIRVEPEECGQDHRFRIIRIIGPDGVAVGGPEAPVVPFNSPLEPDARFGSFTCVTHMGLVFLVAGVYRFVFAVDDIEIGELELDILPTQNQPQAGVAR